ncbi:hypothetical protein [Flavobacterium sp. 3HN19-14]|uniref:hypothetical protein n=1 Tax=Flavobacterium sp. 3HN19-14 TaxID=3448133 RepID=UPI003EE14956
MKTKLFTLFFIFPLILHAQSFSLDPTFGEGGVKYNLNVMFTPKSVKLINDSYYFISTTYTGSDQIAKVSYDGTSDVTFGTNGIMSFGTSNVIYRIKDLKNVGDFLYLFGTVTEANNKDAFICKLDLNGNFDSSFGISGMLKIDFGGQELFGLHYWCRRKIILHWF